jgi:GMP synthase-like glutamine amidotransferase
MHMAFEKPGYIVQWAKEKNYNFSTTKLYEPFTLPELNEFDWLIVMGGPMGVYDEDKYPWLKEEKAFIKKAIDNKKIVLGICLGSQLIAEVLGAKVFPNKHKEIGWFKIKTTEEAGKNDLFGFFPKEAIVFHWHGDTYNLPPGAVHLAESEACKNQAFLYNERVIGLQFHIEVTDKLLSEMLEGLSDELKKDTFVQTDDKIREDIHHCNENNLLLHQLLNNIEEKYKAK